MRFASFTKAPQVLGNSLLPVAEQAMWSLSNFLTTYTVLNFSDSTGQRTYAFGLSFVFGFITFSRATGFQSEGVIARQNFGRAVAGLKRRMFQKNMFYLVVLCSILLLDSIGSKDNFSSVHIYVLLFALAASDLARQFGTLEKVGNRSQYVACLAFLLAVVFFFAVSSSILSF